jgi:hypothetical protein
MQVFIDKVSGVLNNIKPVRAGLSNLFVRIRAGLFNLLLRIINFIKNPPLHKNPPLLTPIRAGL